MTRLEIIKDVTDEPEYRDGTDVITFEELRSWLKAGMIARRAFRYRSIRLRVPRLATLAKPLATAGLLRLLSRGRCEIVDAAGERQDIGLRSLASLSLGLLRDRVGLRRVIRAVHNDLDRLDESGEPDPAVELDLTKCPVYLRTDLVFGLEAGGSVGHIAGVLNNLSEFAGPPSFVTTDRIPTVDATVETVVVEPDGRLRDFTDAPLLAFNRRVLTAATHAVADSGVAFVYQRYSAYNYAGVALARRLRVPFVLEYNGSEVWTNRHWGRPLRYEVLAERIEMLDLRSADLVVVVSAVMRGELLDRGINRDRILVNPNGVDPVRYSPDIDGSSVRSRLGIQDDHVIGFIGTFGRWHGAENLAHAFNQLLDGNPHFRERVILLMIGDGVRLPATRQVIEGGAYTSRVIFTGRVPQAEGPSYLAACDMLVSPHVPNPDGTPFFGSPTKLFEYMAMGKPIVASGLEQIAEIVDDERTAIVVEPGSVDGLANGMGRVIDSPELGARLGAAAREDAVANHTWREHTRKILKRLEELCA